MGGNGTATRLSRQSSEAHDRAPIEAADGSPIGASPALRSVGLDLCDPATWQTLSPISNQRPAT